MKLQDQGILLIDKPQGLTSFGVVARIRRVLSEQFGRKIKVGHTGTLDPFATGLMILVIRPTCKQAQLYTKLDKSYQTKIILGKTSSTGDVEGRITYQSKIRPSRATIEASLEQFKGQIWQTPPIFSAIKIGGKRAYKLAREGRQVEIPKRQVTIYDLEIINYNYPILEIKVSVSSGTYIRSLASDIGKVLGTGAYCQSLRRLSIDQYQVAEAIKLVDLGVNS